MRKAIVYFWDTESSHQIASQIQALVFPYTYTFSYVREIHGVATKLND